MATKRDRYRTKVNKKKKKKIHINTGRLFAFFFIICIVGYLVYGYIALRDIKSVDILEKSNSNYYLLSERKDQLEKTLIVFEEEYNEREKISMAYLYAQNKEKGSSVLVYIPGWVEYSGVKEDFGSSIPIASFRFAGDFLQEGRGYEYAIWQFEQLLGGNIDEYIWVTPQARNIFSQGVEASSAGSVYAQYYSNGFEVNQEVFFLNVFASKLGWFNLLKSAPQLKDSNAEIYSSLSTLGGVISRFGQIQSDILSSTPYVIDLSSSKYLSQQESLSGVGITSYVNVDEYDIVWREFIDNMLDRELEREQVRVEVYNGSGMTGYAGQYARKIRNSGCEVVRYDNAPQLEEKTKFYVPKAENFKNSLDVILELFPGTYEIIEGRPSFMTTGDIVIILGKDIPTVYSF